MNHSVSASASARIRRAVDGVLLLDKPPEMTSNRALQWVKWCYGARKGGHTGSLDPFASGMLPICLGEATKFAGLLLDADKIYRVRIRFGTRTDTGDAEGRPTETGRTEIPPELLELALERFRGPIAQVPPMYSALKHQGRRLYELARAGREVRREPRMVHITELVVEQADPRYPVLRVRCSKGTYIRTLVEDIATAVGTVAYACELRRLAVLPFQASAMVDAAAVEAARRSGLAALDALLLPVDCLLAGWPSCDLTAEAARGLRHGGAVGAPPGTRPGFVRLYDEGGTLLGLGEVLPDGRLAPRRLLAQAARIAV